MWYGRNPHHKLRCYIKCIFCVTSRNFTWSFVAATSFVQKKKKKCGESCGVGSRESRANSYHVGLVRGNRPAWQKERRKNIMPCSCQLLRSLLMRYARVTWCNLTWFDVATWLVRQKKSTMEAAVPDVVSTTSHVKSHNGNRGSSRYASIGFSCQAEQK